jgi:hypothetical protein
VKKLAIFLVLAALLLTTLSAAASGGEQIRTRLVPVGGSGITGKVILTELSGGGTNIRVVARGLVPGVEYTSLYYDNDTCALEPYEDDDVIGVYTANTLGVGNAQSTVEDDLEEIQSVSVRRVSDFALLSCAVVP